MALELVSRIPQNPRPTPILFVHGAWHGAWCWQDHFFPYFAEHGYACYALSMRGHGNSPGRERLRTTRMRDYVADVSEIVGALPQPPILVGHSMGGLVVQKYLETRQAPAAVLLAPVPVHGAWQAAVRFAWRYPLQFLKTNLTLSLYPLVGTLQQTREALFSSDIQSESLQKYFGCIQDESYCGFLDMLAFGLPHPARVKTPLLILGGENDAVFAPSEVKSTARAYGTTAQIIPGIAHDVMLDTAWKRAAEAIVAWLQTRNL